MNFALIDHYQNFLNFKNNYDWDADEDVTKAKKFGYYDPVTHDDRYLLEGFLFDVYGYDYAYNATHYFGVKPVADSDEKINEKEYFLKYNDLEFNVLQSFPKEIVLGFAKQNFEGRSICYYNLLHIELVKYTYHIWKKFVNKSPDNFEYPDNEFCILINKIQEHLLEVVYMDVDKYYDILQNSRNPRFDSKKNYIYYTWWLYAYLPLLDEPEEKILKLVDFVYLNDAQDMLLYGIYQMNTTILAPLMKKLMLTLWKQEEALPGIRGPRPCYEMWSGGTGAWTQTVDILGKLYHAGYNLMEDPELTHVETKI